MRHLPRRACRTCATPCRRQSHASHGRGPRHECDRPASHTRHPAHIGTRSHGLGATLADATPDADAHELLRCALRHELAVSGYAVNDATFNYLLWTVEAERERAATARRSNECTSVGRRAGGRGGDEPELGDPDRDAETPEG